MRIQTVVQHHQSRAHLLPGLLTSLPPGATVIPDPGGEKPNPWRAYLACLRALELDADSLCVIQDDAIVCRDFPAVLDLVAARHPDVPLVLFVPGVGLHRRRILDACAEGKRFVQMSTANTFLPCVAILWPRECVEAILAYEAATPFSKPADDGCLGRWCEVTRTKVLATVPSLVEHPDRERSLVGKLAMGGRNPSRIAACWTGSDWSPLELEW